ncbi:calcium-transporting ATPase 12, plasma membrane-type-like [Aristolochia californica]|uniref:calcium-transporting ATPase 12, plasma membrane-type-like n=1 Tax=Aristolochia californica TaxID=171875 RepID=UPI0035E1BE17
MSTPTECLSYILDVAPNGARKRWRFAFATLWAVRSLQSLIETKSRLLSQLPHLSRSSSFISINIIPGLGDRRDLQEAVDQDSLRDIVKSKDLLRLAQLGGVRSWVSALGTNPSEGVDGDSQSLSRRRRMFGSNTYPATFPKDFFFFLWESFKENILLVLLACAVLCRVIGGVEEHDLNQGWADGCRVFAAVVLVIVAGAIGNLRLSRQLEDLTHDICHMRIDVVRSGQRNSVSIFDIVVGDVVFLSIGDRIPADGLLLHGSSLRVDESSITGEGNPVVVNETQNPFLVSGSSVADGSGRMLVTNVGMEGNKNWEAFLTSIKGAYKGQTPLQARLDQMTLLIGKVGTVLAVVALIVLSFRHFLIGAEENNKRGVSIAENKLRQVMDKIALVLAGVVAIVVNENAHQGYHDRRTKFRQVTNAAASVMTASITVVVVTIPEGWPFAFTWALAWSLRKMRDDQVLVRTPSACETMGLVTTICSDEKSLQTMKVTQFWLGGESFEKDAFSGIANDTLELLHQGIGMNCSTVIPDSLPELIEKEAICFWAFSETGMDTKKLMENYSVVFSESSRSQNKIHGVLVQNNNDKSRHVHWKGDVEVILSICSSCLDGTGIPMVMDERAKDKVREMIQGTEAHKLIAFAHREIRVDETGVELQLPKDGFTFLGMVSCDMDIKDTIEDFRDAQISFRLVTDVCAADAKAIAIECGLLREDNDFKQVIILGEDFRNYSMEERMEKIGNICVIAEASPQDRLLMVQCLKKNGEVVAVTGHGSDHARALEEADVGVLMGNLGTEEARKSCDVIILDGKFSSVMKVVGWGRCFYRNIQKFIQFQLTINVAAAVLSFTSALSWDYVPISEAQLLSLHLIFGILGAIALATDHPTQCLMKKKALGRTEPIVTNFMWRNLITQALYQISMLLFLDSRGRTIFHANPKVKNAVVFNAFIVFQVFNVFNARSLEKKNVFKGIHQNKFLLGSVGMALTLQVLMLEFSSKVTDAEGLALWQWGACVGIAATSWPLGWLMKVIPVPDKFFLVF